MKRAHTYADVTTIVWISNREGETVSMSLCVYVCMYVRVCVCVHLQPDHPSCSHTLPRAIPTSGIIVPSSHGFISRGAPCGEEKLTKCVHSNGQLQTDVRMCQCVCLAVCVCGWTCCERARTDWAVGALLLAATLCSLYCVETLGQG